MIVLRDQITKAEDRVTRWSLLLGIIIWFVDLNTVYALPSLACEWEWLDFKIAGIPALVFIEGIITLVALLLMVLMIYLPWREWRMFQTVRPTHNPRVLSDTEKNSRALTAFVAMLLNVFFLLFIIATFVPMATLNACVHG